MTRIFDKFRNDIKGILWLALAVFLGMTLASFNPADPSFNSVSIGAVHKVTNLCGYFGSFLGDFLYQLLGVTAWLIVVACLRLAYLSFRSISPKTNHLVRFCAALF